MKARVSCVDKKRPRHLASGVLNATLKASLKTRGSQPASYLLQFELLAGHRKLTVAAKVTGGAKPYIDSKVWKGNGKEKAYLCSRSYLGKQ
jgi:hypothetical protein